MLNTFFLLLTMLIGFGSVAAQELSNTRLAREEYQHPDGIFVTAYQYSPSGNIKTVQNLKGKKLQYTETQFVFNAKNQIISFVRKYANGLTPTETYTFDYGNDGTLLKQTVTNLYDGKEKFLYANTYKWGNSDIVVTEERASFAGRLIRPTVYKLNADGNITQENSLDKNGKIVYVSFVNKSFDDKINPNLLRGNYGTWEINSKNNYTKQDPQGSATNTKVSYIYNANGTPKTQKIVYQYKDYDVTHTVNYSYITVNAPPTKSDVKDNTGLPDAVTTIALAQNALAIQAYQYKQQTLYRVNPFANRDSLLKKGVQVIKYHYYDAAGNIVITYQQALVAAFNRATIWLPQTVNAKDVILMPGRQWIRKDNDYVLRGKSN